MLRFFAKRRARASQSQFTAPVDAPGPIYAVGDVHGRHDLLARLTDRIMADAEALAARPSIVFLGDYIDRGDHTRETLDHLMALADAPEADTVFLMGNHEQMLLSFLAKPEDAVRWLQFGGRETLLSYGVGGLIRTDSVEALTDTRDRLASALGPHLGFIEAMRLCHRAGNVFFAHAGADPGIPVEEQDVSVLLWGTPRFQEAERSDGVWVVHGHTVVDRASSEKGRIAVDTGAYFSGKLTAARIHAGEVSFLQS